MRNPLRVLVVGCGRMGSCHASAYEKLDGFVIAGLVSRRSQTRNRLNKRLGGAYPVFDDFERALADTRPDVISINTYPDTHEAYAVRAFELGCHVFLEKPVALTEKGCRRVIRAARDAERKLVVGYILRHHPLWIRFVEIAQTLGKPLVMRMSLNRQSSGVLWERHKNLLAAASTLIDSGVHYADIMCWMTGAKPVRVSAIGARLSQTLSAEIHDFGQFQVTFDDGSVGWYESGWGPMMSHTAESVRDAIGPEGSVSIVEQKGSAWLMLHHSRLDENNRFTHQDEIIDIADAPHHGKLCKREQEFFLRAIRENLDLTGHWNDALISHRIVMAADESIRTGKTVVLRQS